MESVDRSIIICSAWERTTPIVTAQSNVQQRGAVLFQTARAVAVGLKGRKNVRVLIDSGSNQSFVSSELSALLGGKQLSHHKRTITTFGGDSLKVRTMRNVLVTLEHPSNQECVQISATEIDQICGPVNTQPIDVSGYEYLRRLTLADPPDQWNDEQGIDVLIGMDHYKDIVKGAMQASDDGPIAMESIFGWLLGGRASMGATSNDSHVMFLNTKTSQDLYRLWNLETIGIESPSHPSKCEEKQRDDEQAIEHFENTHTREQDGRYLDAGPPRQVLMASQRTLRSPGSEWSAVKLP